ncbi:hypothetical protein GCM10027341_45130 [Spirosoma knui]
MEDLSPDQIVAVADGYRDIARSLNEFQVLHWPALTYEQHVDLNAYQSSLLNRAQDLQTLAVRPAFNRAADLISRIQQATDEAKASLRRVKNMSIALNIGAITVALASYVARANVRGIETALQELGELVLTEE